MDKREFLFFSLVFIVVGGFFVATIKNSNRAPTQTAEVTESGTFLKNSAFINGEDYTANAVYGKRKKNNTSRTPTLAPTSTSTSTLTPTQTDTSSFSDVFSTDSKIEETGSLGESSDVNWWVNSGAWLTSSSGTGKTLQGDLNKLDKWYQEYLRTNPIDTDNGLHPQNLFRFVQKGNWTNLTQQTYFKINKFNASNSPNRNASNSLFLFNRYQSGDNLYYTGLRVDGAVVIKKKMNGAYYTMAYKSIFSGASYDRVSNPNLLPLNTWVGLKSEVVTGLNNTVSIKVYTDVNKTGIWTLVLDSIDNNSKYGGSSLLSGGYSGIRVDFMDVEFDDYKIAEF